MVKDGAMTYGQGRARHRLSKRYILIAYGDRLDSCHPVQIVGMLSHTDDLRNDLNLRPLDSECLCKLLEVDDSRLPDAVYIVAEP